MYDLRSFTPIREDLRIHSEVKREGGLLNIRFVMSGELDKILFPPQAPNPSRRDELWKRTCFEVFFGPRGRASYWELNFSPSGDWNGYSFEDYRKGMKMEEKVSVGPLRCSRSPDSFTLDVVVDISKLVRESDVLEISATAVIENANGALSYWAIRHAGAQPDFHLRGSFT